MIIIVGLGNPGKKYKSTRHNVGFQVVDEFAKENNFPEFKLSKKFNALVSENIINGKKIILAKPQTFMNNSGKPVKTLFSFYKPKEWRAAVYRLPWLLRNFSATCIVLSKSYEET